MQVLTPGTIDTIPFSSAKPPYLSGYWMAMDPTSCRTIIYAMPHSHSPIMLPGPHPTQEVISDTPEGSMHIPLQGEFRISHSPCRIVHEFLYHPSGKRRINET
ncbi:hypothetical protein QAD02_012984 [Eretmocerus hayati]|uniref:Uncharacterized protein n=1 Tax=Eretmocerus hayati TaxID=131215 RepID=A0ACC2P1F8_9HYME|nr:hypothetical protein QAD02_012984 [Eretmocerus hayati]